jgi:hypothetical protein
MLAAQVEPFVRLSVKLMPMVFPALWTLVVIIDLWLGAKVVARSDRLARPWEDLSAVRLPAGAGLAFVAAGLATLLPSPIGLLAGPFAGALFSIHMLIGFAVLHVMTRGNAARPIVLAALYGIVFLFTFPAIIVALIGLADGIFRIRDRRRPGPPPPTP